MSAFLTNPLFSEVLESDKLRPKHFCELFGLPANYATHLKKMAVLDKSKKLIVVSSTIDKIIISNVFKKVNWVEIRNNFPQKNLKKSKSENEKSKNLKKSKKKNHEKTLEVIESSEDDSKETVNKEINKSKNQIIESKNLNNISEHWIKTLYSILGYEKKQNNITKTLFEIIESQIESPDLGTKNTKELVEAYQKLKNTLKDDEVLLHKDIATFIIGTICEFMMINNQGILTKVLRKNNIDEQQIKDSEIEFLNLIDTAKNDVQQIIQDRLNEVRN